MSARLIDRYRKATPFHHFSDPEWAQVTRRARYRRYRQDEIIAHYGDRWPYLFLVLEGAVHAVKQSVEGRSLIILELQEGEVFWGLAFYADKADMPVTLVARGECQIAMWAREDLLELLLRESKSLWDICGLMVERMERASSIVEGLAFQPVAGRLARLLLEHYGGVDGPTARDLSLEEMAAHVGSTREMVCRMLYRFSDDRLIDITRTEFTLIDHNGLGQLAGEDTQA
jgi:CRP/FNR family transcriptional regulator